MDRRELLALSGALAAATLAGCATESEAGPDDDGQPSEESDDPQRDDGDDQQGSDGNSQQNETNQTEPGTDGDDTPGESDQSEVNDENKGESDGEQTALPEGGPTVEDERLAELAAGNAAFALDLHRWLAENEGGNTFLSPYSISTAFAMTYAGARGETATEMREALHYTLGEDIHPALSELDTKLESRAQAEESGDDEEGDRFQLSTANSIWAQKGLPLADTYRTLLDEHYGAGVQEADFRTDPEGERKRINEWVEEQTEDRIEDLLPPDSIKPRTVMVLTNAIYFMASWAEDFDPENTEDRSFTALDGSTSTVPMMKQNLEADYAELPRAQAIELPYLGGDVSMVLLVPDEGEFEAVEGDLDSDYLFGVFEELGEASGDLRMPKFEYEFKTKLKEPLRALGMKKPFTRSADFLGMVEGDGPEMYIDEGYHKAFVSVDEEGTEAAAATAVTMAVTSVNVTQESFDITVDRPFLFFIRDRPTDAVLFLGRVTDVGEAQEG
jgi:serpin B